MGRRDFLNKGWNVAFVLMCTAFLIDVAGTWADWGVVRFSRPARPLLIVYDSSHVRRLASSILRTVPNILDFTLFALLLMIVYAVMGVQLLSGLYVDDDTGEALNVNFDSISSSMLSLWMFLSTQAIPEVMYPALAESWWYMIFFGSFLVLVLSI